LRWLMILAPSLWGAAAQASLISFDLDGQIGCGSGESCIIDSEMALFSAQTGLPVNGVTQWDFTARFTIDTNAPVTSSSDGKTLFATIDQPGTGLEFSIGNLTLFSTGFSLQMGRDSTLGPCNVTGGGSSLFLRSAPGSDFRYI